jgi:hypothetical protein
MMWNVQATALVLLLITTPLSAFAALAIIRTVTDAYQMRRQAHHVQTSPAVAKVPA